MSAILRGCTGPDGPAVALVVSGHTGVLVPGSDARLWHGLLPVVGGRLRTPTRVDAPDVLCPARLCGSAVMVVRFT